MRLLVTVISLLGLILACPSGSSGSATVNKTPSSSHYEIVGIRNVNKGTALNITVQKKAGVEASGGAISAPVFTNADELTPAYNSATPPTEIGLYDVKIDVAAATGWDEAKGLFVGSVSIKNPGKDDQSIENFDLSDFPNGIASQLTTDSKRPAVRVKAGVTGVTNADITTYYGGSTNFPTGSTAAGTYAVTFNVKETDKYNPIAGLSAGLLVLRDPGSPSPVTEIDFIDFNFQVGDKATDVFVGPTTELPVEYTDDYLKLEVTGKTPNGVRYIAIGADTAPIITYWQKNPVEGRPDIQVGYPFDVGGYSIHVRLPAYVNVNNDDAFNQLYFELPLKVTKRVPKLSDFNVTKTRQAEASVIMQQNISVEDVSVESKYDSLDGTVTVEYSVNGTWQDTPPQTRGTYPIRFSVDESSPSDADIVNWDTAENIDAGNLEVVALSAVNPSFTGTYLFWVDDGVLTLNKDLQYINPGQTITFTVPSGEYTVLEWWEDGKKVEGITGNTLTFSKTALEWHSVAVVVSYKGRVYSASVDFRVQTES